MRARHWDHRWRTTEGFDWEAADVAPELDVALAQGWIQPEARVLDIGCGAGSAAAWLADLGCDVLGVDISAHAVAQARRRHGDRPRLAFDTADVTRPGALEMSFDLVLDRGCLHTIPEELHSGYAANVTRWVRPGGSLIVIMHTKAQSATERRRRLERLLGGELSVVDSIEDVVLGMRDGRRDLRGVAFHLVRRRDGEEAGTGSSP